MSEKPKPDCQASWLVDVLAGLDEVIRPSLPEGWRIEVEINADGIDFVLLDNRQWHIEASVTDIDRAAAMVSDRDASEGKYAAIDLLAILERCKREPS